LRRSGAQAPRSGRESPQKVLFRVFFHPHGDKVLLLLGGYDKAKHSSSTYQNCPDPDRTKALGGLAGPAPPTPEVASLDLAMHKAHNENMAKTWNQFMKGLQARAKAGGAEHVRTLRALRSHYRRMGQELAEERKKLGMSQERLAKTTGIDQAEISRIERDIVDPRLGTYVKLLEGVGLGLRVERVHKGASARPRQVSGRRVGR